METFIQHQAFIEPIAEVMVRSLLATTIILVVMWGVLAFCKSLSASIRHRVLVLGLATSMLVPLTTFMSPSILPKVSQNVVLSSAGLERVEKVAVTPTMVLNDAGTGDVERMTTEASPSAASFPFPWVGFATLLLGIWFVGMAWRLGKLCQQWHVCQRILKRSIAVSDDATHRRARQLQKRFGLTQPIRLYCSQAVDIPITMGVRSPVIVLPVGYGKWKEHELDLVLRHELLHVKRLDTLCQAIAGLAAAVYWFHPLVALAERRLHIERELACDDAVIQTGAVETDYADLLVTVAAAAAHGPQLNAIAMYGRKQLQTRVKHLLGDDRNRNPIGDRTGSFMTVVALTLLTVATACTPQLSFANTADQDESASPQESTKQETPEAVVLIMHPAELPRANTIQRAAAAAGLAQLSKHDSCGILRFSTGGVQWLWSKPPIRRIGNRHDELLSDIQASRTGDLPDFEPALQMAFAELTKLKNVRRRVLMLTDGDPAAPKSSTLAKFKSAGIPITVVHADIHGIGKDGLAHRIAAKTGGKYYYVLNADSKVISNIFRRECRNAGGASRTDR